MAMTREDNELLTRVENGAPMGEMIRQHYWLPVVPSIKLQADGAPLRVRLLGRNFVAFRATDGSVGVLDEQCGKLLKDFFAARRLAAKNRAVAPVASCDKL